MFGSRDAIGIPAELRAGQNVCDAVIAGDVAGGADVVKIAVAQQNTVNMPTIDRLEKRRHAFALDIRNRG